MERTLLTFISLVGLLVGISAQNHVCVLGSKNDNVVLRSVAIGKNAKTAAAAAERHAVEYVMYVGCSGTKYSMPLIQDDKAAVESKNKAFFDDFNANGYSNFVESIEIAVPYGKNGLKQKTITLDICVRVKQLREHLERNGIIRHFGL